MAPPRRQRYGLRQADALAKVMADTVSLRRQADAGDPRAQTALAYAMLSQDGPTSAAPAVELLNTAAKRDHVDALFLLAALTMLGVGRARKLDDAYGFIKRAAAMGDKSAKGQLAVLGRDAFDKAPWLQPVHLVRQVDAPRIFMVENFLPRSACDWLIEVARPQLKPSVVYDAASGSWATHPSRTSETANFRSLEHDLVTHLVSWRIASTVGVPMLNQEGSKVLRYAQGQEYRPHFDFIRPGVEAEAFGVELAKYGQRIVTVLIYLNDDYDGGETHFPRLDLKFRGKVGDALVFWNLSETGELERNSLHAGLPVTAGEKWLLSKWIRQKPLPLF